MKWTRPADIRAQVQRLWDRGDILAATVAGTSLFPCRLVLKTPTSTEISNGFDDVRSWIGELRGIRFCRLESREVRHRVFGTNALPHEIWIDSLDDALALIGKRRDAARFSVLVDATRKRQPKLLPWLERRPMRALDLADDWDRLLAVVSWVEVHPRPGIYIRQMDLPGVHTKFIEAHRGVLSELLDAVLPVDAMDA
ncbi:MAG: DUF3322 domain-containing protein, partial [Myxococcota bacterium]